MSHVSNPQPSDWSDLLPVKMKKWNKCCYIQELLTEETQRRALNQTVNSSCLMRLRFNVKTNMTKEYN